MRPIFVPAGCDGMHGPIDGAKTKNKKRPNKNNTGITEH